MDFGSLRHLKPHVPLKIIERDLSQMPEMRKKPIFTEEDLKIDYTSERLQKGEIEIPIFKDSFIRPFTLKGRLVQYFVKNLGGGFYEFTFQNGKMEPKPTDRRYPNKEINRQNGGEIKFWIGYNHEKRHYYALEEEDTFKKKYAAVEESIMREDVMTLLGQFEAFITTFLSESYLATHKMSGTNGTSVKSYHDILMDLHTAFPMLKQYHELLNILNDIDDPTYTHIINTLNHWEKQVKHSLSHINQHLDLNWTIEDLRTHWEEFKPVNEFYSSLTTDFWKRGYYIDPIHNDAFPNLLEIHYQRQLADSQHFESDETLRIKKEEIYRNNIGKAKKETKILFFKTE